MKTQSITKLTTGLTETGHRGILAKTKIELDYLNPSVTTKKNELQMMKTADEGKVTIRLQKCMCASFR